jgi:hypothetical protein
MSVIIWAVIMAHFTIASLKITVKQIQNNCLSHRNLIKKQLCLTWFLNQVHPKCCPDSDRLQLQAWLQRFNSLQE